jgi:hypothetical protein
VTDCKKDMKNLNNRLQCAQDVLMVMSFVDPTGLTTMAAAFVQPICDV